MLQAAGQRNWLTDGSWDRRTLGSEKPSSQTAWHSTRASREKMRQAPPILFMGRRLVPFISCRGLKNSFLHFLETSVFLALFFFPVLFCDVAWIMMSHHKKVFTSLGKSGAPT